MKHFGVVKIYVQPLEKILRNDDVYMQRVLESVAFFIASRKILLIILGMRNESCRRITLIFN